MDAVQQMASKIGSGECLVKEKEMRYVHNSFG